MFSSSCAADTSGLLLFSTDYISSGYSKSNGKSVVQANVDYEFTNGVYTGLWISPVDFNDTGISSRSSIEVAPYLGWGTFFNPDWRADFRVTHYWYDENIFGQKSDYDLFDVGLSYKGVITAHVSWSPDYYNRSGSFYEYSLSGRYPLNDVLDLSAGIGYSDANEVLEYNFVLANIGITWYHQDIAVDLRVNSAHQVDEVLQPGSQHFEPLSINTELILSISYVF